ncbi:MAG TPA: hypothetical protein VET65_14385 [Candidatus Limnocylindrales bacterium]|nr:hypothetical protein [Candidatus Limnocylindrales bacterium]
MILFLLLLVAAYVVVGVYAYQNPWTHDMTLFTWHWSAVPAWGPVVLASVAIGVLFLLYMIYAGAVHGVRYGSVRRRVATHESTIADLRTDNTRLREENARLRGQLRGVTSAAEAPATAPVIASGAPAYTDRPASGEPAVVADQPASTDRSTMGSRVAPAYRPRPTFGERVRAFFGGREPSSY